MQAPIWTCIGADSSHLGRPLRIIEIGCWEGRSSCYLLLRLARHPESRLICVDPFDLLHLQFEANRVAWGNNIRAALRQLSSELPPLSAQMLGSDNDAASPSRRSQQIGGGKVQLLQESSKSALPWLLSNKPGAESFDLVYVDGSHMCADVLFDALLAFELLRPGGVIVFDDYEWDRYRHNPACHPKRAVDGPAA